MSVSNNHNFPETYVSYFQNVAPSNFPDIMNSFPFPNSIILDNYKPVGVTNYSEINPISSINIRATSPRVNKYIKNPLMNYNQAINSYQLKNNNSIFFPINKHRRIDTQNLIKYTNPYFNIKLIDEDNFRERPFYNRPNEKLPEQKNYKRIIPKTYNVNIKTNHIEIDTQKHIDFKALIEEKNKEQIEKAKNDMFMKEKEKRLNNKDNLSKNEKINNYYEDIAIYGNVTKKEIEEEKINKPEKYIGPEKAQEMENSNPEIFALGLLASILEQNNIDTIIDVEIGTNDKNKDMDQLAKEEEEAITSLQFVTNESIRKKKYDLYFEFDNGRVLELLSDENEYNKFKDDLKSKLSKDYNIPKDKIIVTFPQRGSFHVQVIFQSDEFNDLDLDEFKRKFKNEKQYKELSKLKKVESGLILQGCKLSVKQLDPRGNRYYGWAENEKRGMEYYKPPKGWIGIGLRVFDKYENDRWIGMINVPGEWVVAYHGVGGLLPPKDVVGIPGDIYRKGFRAGKRQNHKDCDDYFHPGQKVGEGVYCTPYIHIAEQYAGISEFKGKKYKTVVMVRVNPKARRHCFKCKESRLNQYWVVNGTTDEIRPYRILYKRIQ